MFRRQFAGIGDAISRRRIPPTNHGQLRLHRLERPLPWDLGLIPLIETELQQQAATIQQYPDYVPLYDAIAKWCGVKPDQIVVGQGAESLIRDLFMLTIEPYEDAVVYPYPSCAMFEVYAKAFEAQVEHVHPTASTTDTAFFKDLVNVIRTTHPKLLILPNPGQPVDTMLDLPQLETLAQMLWERDRGILVVDEAYYGFGGWTAKPLALGRPNVVVLRSFSKAFGLAGARVGWAIASPEIIRTLHAVRESGEVSGPSAALARLMLENWPLVEERTTQIIEGRNWLRDCLVTENWNARGTWANHVLVGPDDTLKGIVDAMAPNALVRGTELGGEYHALITCGPLRFMQRFYKECWRSVA